MNEKEIGELRRRFRQDKHNIACLRGCYVNEKKEIISSFEESMLMLPEDEAEKFLTIFRRTLSGKPGKNLLDVPFSTKQVTDGEEYAVLSALRKSELKDEDALKRFYESVIGSLELEGNYLLLLITDTYDVPVRAHDGASLEDSDTMFRYILCSICPVRQTKPALRYAASSGSFHNLSAEWVVAAPELGFLFPAFDGRRTNIYNALFYTKNAGKGYDAFTDAVFHTAMPMPADEQKEAFCTLLSNTLKEECSYDVFQSVQGQLQQKLEEHKAAADPEPLYVTKKDVSYVLSACGVSEERVQAFDEQFDETFGQNADVPPANIIDTRRIELKTPDVTVRVNPERGDIIQTRVIDGTKYILIRAEEDVEVNGVSLCIQQDRD